MALEHVDVIIVGAGLSGVGAAYHLQKRAPGKSYIILEGRGAIGGTWDIHRYPGVRSDSDMFTLGYIFKPWKAQKAIADGASILSYVRETAAENGIDRKICFNHKVIAVNWEGAASRWVVEAEHEGKRAKFTCSFLLTAAGYYQYAKPYLPDWPGMADFQGDIVHPMFWKEDLNYSGKRVIVVGSGATAVTVVPEMAKSAAHVTMLQRSPTYMVAAPAEDALANFTRKLFPAQLAYGITRWRKILLQMLMFRVARKTPQKAKDGILELLRKEGVPEDVIAQHLTPKYNVWDQRVCLVPDGDLFGALKAGKAEIVTDEIATFTKDGVALKSGKNLQADIVVAATGFNLETVGGAKLSVDGRPVDVAKTFVYKGVMYSGVPNLVNFMGYTNASWTLKSDLTAEYVCRLMKWMDAKGFASATPRPADPAMAEAPWIDFTSGYVARAAAYLPKQGARPPWRLYQNYFKDMMSMRFGKIADPELLMQARAAAPAAEAVEKALPAAAA